MWNKTCKKDENCVDRWSDWVCRLTLNEAVRDTLLMNFKRVLRSTVLLRKTCIPKRRHFFMVSFLFLFLFLVTFMQTQLSLRYHQEPIKIPLVVFRNNSLHEHHFTIVAEIVARRKESRQFTDCSTRAWDFPN